MRHLAFVILTLALTTTVFAESEYSWTLKEGRLYRLVIEGDKVLYREEATKAEFKAFSDEVLHAGGAGAVVFERAKKAFSRMARVELADGFSWRLKGRNKGNFMREFSFLPISNKQAKKTDEEYQGLVITPFPSSGEIVELRIFRGFAELRLGEETTTFLDKGREMERWLLSTGRKTLGTAKLKELYSKLTVN